MPASLLVKIIPSLDRSALTRGLRRVEAFGEKVGGVISRAFSLEGALALGGLGLAIERTANFGQELSYLAQQSGNTTESLLATAAATQSVGISMEKFADQSKDLRDRLGDYITAQGGTFQDLVDILGITNEEGQALAKTFQGMESADVFTEIVTMATEAGASTEQLTFLMESLASDSVRLLPLLQNGGEELMRIRNEFMATRSNLLISDEEAERLSEIKASFSNLFTTFTLAASKLTLAFGGGLMDGFKAITVWINENTPKIIAFFDTIANSTAVQVFAAVIDAALRILGRLFEAILGNSDAVIVALVAIGAAFAATPIGMITTAIAAFLLVFDDLVTFLEGGKSAFPEFWKAAIDGIQPLIAFIDGLIGEVTRLFDMLNQAGEWLGEKTFEGVQFVKNLNATNEGGSDRAAGYNGMMGTQPQPAMTTSNSTTTSTVNNHTTEVTVNAPGLDEQGAEQLGNGLARGVANATGNKR